MANDDPFIGADAERTVLKPSPGGRTALPKSVNPVAREAPAVTGDAQYPGAATERDAWRQRDRTVVSWRHLGGSSRLVSAAGALLCEGAMLRNSYDQPDVPGLFQQLLARVQAFEQQARDLGCGETAWLSARYILCTYLDECVLSTPWGADSDWSSQTLLVTCHREAWGGEKFFSLLEHLLAEPQRNQDLLELMYFCLIFGFKGLYGVRGDEAGLRALQQRLASVLRRVGSLPERGLSPHWEGATTRPPRLARYLPLWVVFAVAGVLLLAIYAGFGFVLDTSVNPLLERIGRL